MRLLTVAGAAQVGVNAYRVSASCFPLNRARDLSREHQTGRSLAGHSRRRQSDGLDAAWDKIVSDFSSLLCKRLFLIEKYA